MNSDYQDISAEFSFRKLFLNRFSGTFIIRVTALVLGLVVQIILARLLGTSGYGTFSLAFTIPTLAGMIAAFGFSQYLVRETSAGIEGQRFGYVSGLLRFSFRLVFVLAIVIGGMLALAFSILKWPAGEEAQVAVLLGLIAVPIYALINQRQGALSGLHRVEFGQLPENLLRPVLFLSALGVVYLLARNWITEVNVVALNLGALLIAVSVGWFLLIKTIPKEISSARKERHHRKWIRGAAAFLLIAGLSRIQSQTDIIMLGALKDTEAVGLYTVPARLATLITFLFFAANLVLAPTIAKLWERGDRVSLQKLVIRSSRFVTLLTLPAAIALAVFPEFWLSFFGEDFKGGANALIILCLAWFVNVSLGPVTHLLSMTGHERLMARIVAVTTVVNITLNAILIPRYGIEGAAIATGVSFLVWKGTALIIVKRRLGISANGLI